MDGDAYTPGTPAGTPILIGNREGFGERFARAMYSGKRYQNFRREFPDECAAVLAQFAENACVCGLYPPMSTDIAPVRRMMQYLLPDVEASTLIPGKTKRLYRAILGNNPIAMAIAARLYEKKNW